MSLPCTIIIVTNNSQKHLEKTISCIEQQTELPIQVIIVDTGSKDKSYLKKYRTHPLISLYFGPDGCGFCKGNNIGMEHLVKETEYILLLNPDAFLTKDYLEKGASYLAQHPLVGAITGMTQGFDIDKNAPTGLYDTTGIFRKWYGQWYDRGQGKVISREFYQETEEIPAICGALFFFRRKAVKPLMLRGKELLDETFYMYKEDVDLSLRLKRGGWKLVYLPTLLAYHCRGWQQDRKKMSRRFRLCSAKNDITIQIRDRSLLGTAYAFTKYVSVKLLDL